MTVFLVLLPVLLHLYVLVYDIACYHFFVFLVVGWIPSEANEGNGDLFHATHNDGDEARDA